MYSIEKRRKVDRKAFGSGFDKDIFFGMSPIATDCLNLLVEKTYGGARQAHVDVDMERAEADLPTKSKY